MSEKEYKLKGVKAVTIPKRCKILLWGESGVGKTTLALQFPAPYLIDMERGADLYGDKFDFTVVKTTVFDDVIEQIMALKTQKHAYKTLIVDPISVLWDSFQAKWSEIFLGVREEKAPGSHGSFYEFQPGDYKTINAEWAKFLRLLTSLDMNLICNCHAKTAYKKNSFMVSEGQTWDAQKDTNYAFDTEIQLYIKDGQYLAICPKDKTGKLPMHIEFEPTYEYFRGHFGDEMLNRESEPVIFATPEQCKSILTLADAYGITPSKLKTKLPEYGADSLKELTTEKAQELIDKLKVAIAAKKEKEVTNVTTS
jgi:hypothetical protein